MIDLLKRAFFMLTHVKLSMDDLQYLVQMNVDVKFVNVQELKCDKGVVHFTPMRCVSSHEDFIYPDDETIEELPPGRISPFRDGFTTWLRRTIPTLSFGNNEPNLFSR